MTQQTRASHARNPHRRLVALAALSSAVALGGSLAAGGAAVGSTRRGPHKEARARVAVTVTDAKRGKLGLVLVSGSGRTLYHYARDRRNKSNCTGSCASIWPPLLLARNVHAPKGRNVSHLGTIRRGGRLQVTYNGEPLYLYSGDAKAGETNGQGLLGVWHVVGVAAKHPTTSTSSGGAYGY